MAEIQVYAAESASLDSFKPMTMKRYSPGEYDVSFDMKYCGICHTDVHFVENDLGFSQYPLVPGHELIGVVSAVGDKVTKLKVGDKVGVGCMVDSCQTCKYCSKDEEQYCATGSVFTYGGVTKYGRAGPDGVPTMGGYSTAMVVHEKFAIKVPDDAPLEKAAPLLCAGITMYEPLKYHNVGPGVKVGIVGIGGLGSIGVKIALAMGAEVTGLTSSPGKKEAIEAMGAKCLVTSDPDAVKAAAGSLELILDTVSANHEIMPYSSLLCTDGKLCMIGLTTEPLKMASAALLFGRQTLTGSLIGGVKRTQEMMDFCCSKGVFNDVEVIGMDKIMEKLNNLKTKNDTTKRYVIDCSTIKA